MVDDAVVANVIANVILSGSRGSSGSGDRIGRAVRYDIIAAAVIYFVTRSLIDGGGRRSTELAWCVVLVIVIVVVVVIVGVV